jgi:hypothetical protein
MGYYRRSYMRARTPRQSNPELVSRIEKTASRGVSALSDWERTFMGSLLESAKKWGRLTAKQHEIFQRIEKKTDPSHIKAVADWRQNFTDEMRQRAVFAANYYKANPPYFSDAADKILNDSAFVPSEKLYRKMVENNYVARAIENASLPVKYPAGSMVKIRDSKSVASNLYKFKGQYAMVIAVEEDNYNATKGSRKITILPIGTDKPIETEERYVKPGRV